MERPVEVLTGADGDCQHGQRRGASDARAAADRISVVVTQARDYGRGTARRLGRRRLLLRSLRRRLCLLGLWGERGFVFACFEQDALAQTETVHNTPPPSDEADLRYNSKSFRALSSCTLWGRESGGMVDALALGASGVTRESSSLSFRTSSNGTA